jgi:hypothetical protein
VLGSNSNTIAYRIPIPYTVGTGATAGDLTVSWNRQ